MELVKWHDEGEKKQRENWNEKLLAIRDEIRDNGIRAERQEYIYGSLGEFTKEVGFK